MTGTGRYDTPLQVHPEPDLLELVPVYLERRRTDVAAIELALSAGDFATVQTRGHSMKGSGGGYGFDGITEIGLRLEDAGKCADADAAAAAVSDLRSYLRNVEVLDA